MTDKLNLFELRKNYTMAGLTISDANRDPFKQFAKWLQQAMDAQLPEPNAMMLATAGTNGRVSTRTVLLKHADKGGFVFYTNYNSHKGKQLSENPFAALTFLWLELERQVRIEGVAEKISLAESDEYFASRPRESQLGAWASEQSNEVESRQFLEDTYKSLQLQYEGKPIPRPPHWGGYRVIPDAIEFWQGRPGRMHDRILYQKSASADFWLLKRLAP